MCATLRQPVWPGSVALHIEMMMIVLAAVVSHSTSSGGGSAHIELWQVINLVGSIALATLFLPPVVDDLKRWRRD